MGAWPYAAAAAAVGGQGPPGAPPSAADLYYRQAAAAAALQKPLPYRLYPGMPTLGSLGGIPPQTAPFSHLTASSSLSSLSNYYQNSANNNNSLNGSAANGNSTTNGGSSDHSPRRTPSPINPGSPPARRAQSISPSDDEGSNINV